MPKRPMKPPAAVVAAFKRSTGAPSTTAAAPSAPSSPPASNNEPEGSDRRGRQGRPNTASTKAHSSATDSFVAASTSSPTGSSHVDPQRSRKGAVAEASLPAALLLDATAVAPMFNKSCGENMVELPSSSMRKLGLRVGMLCDVSSVTSGVRLTLVTSEAHDISPPHVVLHPDTLGLLEGKQCTIAASTVIDVIDLCGPALRGERLTLTRLEADVSASDDARSAVFSANQLSGVWVSKFAESVVFSNMIAAVTIATVTCRVRVELPAGIDLGRVVLSTPCVVVPLSGASLVDGDDAEDRVDTAAVAPKHNTVVVGDPGTGKTFTLRSMQRRLEQAKVPLVVVHPTDLAAEPTAADVVRRIRDAFRLASAKAPSFVLCDDVHLVIGNVGESATSRARRQIVATAFAEELDVASSKQVRVWVSAPSTDALPAALRRTGRLDTKLDCHPPNGPSERLDVLRGAMRDACGDKFVVSTAVDTTLVEIASDAFGFRQADLASVVYSAAGMHLEREGVWGVDPDTLREARQRTKPSALTKLEVSVPSVRWDDIGGSEKAKSVLQECARWNLGENRDLFLRLGLNPPRGVLLYGPPGCSKTMLAKALATESKLNFISVKGPEVFSKWVGESEKAVRDIFSKARTVAPCVVFIDELDGMCGHRGGGGVNDRVISQFLAELDGLPSALSGKPDDVMFVAATNRPDCIDAAVLRPGRIDRFVHVGLPAEPERVQIAAIGLRGVPVAPEEENVTPERIASATEGFTGAEVIAVCKEAAYQAIAESEDAEVVCGRHLEQALLRTKPRVSVEDIQWYTHWTPGTAPC